MAQKRLRCFIAMAFGRNDCDAVYNKFILPTLRDLGITPIRVDRRQHRDDLNNYIIRMLREADFVLGDLTYARPSVYYEVGFAEREIPVVYTARADHLSRAQQDDRLRVHFDLEMKKIVTWRDLNDKTFTKRLKQRINYIIRPLIRTIQIDKKLQKDRKDFRSLSVRDQLKIIQDYFLYRLRSKHFWVRPLHYFGLRIRNYYEPHGIFGVISLKKTAGKCICCTVLCGQSFSKKHIEYSIRTNYAAHFVSNWDHSISEYINIHCFCCLRNLPESRLTEAFPNTKPLGKKGAFVIDRVWDHKAYVHLFPLINSRHKLKEFGRPLVDSLDSTQSERATLEMNDFRLDAKVIFGSIKAYRANLPYYVRRRRSRRPKPITL